MADQWRYLKVLNDELRRSLYYYVRRSEHSVTREDAAAAAGISRGLAAFHLDKLVAAGLLTADHEAAKPRGPGRTPKMYRSADQEIELTIPERRYSLLGDILAEGVSGSDAEQAVLAAARERGHAEGRALRLRRPGPERTLHAARQVLDRLGFEPGSDESGGLRLRNCPFRRLAARYPDLVCALNQAFIDGLLRGLDNATTQARLVPESGRCCVLISAH